MVACRDPVLVDIPAMNPLPSAWKLAYRSGDRHWLSSFMLAVHATLAGDEGVVC